MKHDYPSISVSRFFEDMVNEGNVTPEASPMTASDPSMPDLREVPDVDVNDLFGAPKQKKVVTEAKAPQKDLKQEMLELMVEFKQVVQKANKLFSEMAVTAGATTAGMIAPKLGGSDKKSRGCFKKEEAKNGYKKPVKMLRRKQK